MYINFFTFLLFIDISKAPVDEIEFLIMFININPPNAYILLLFKKVKNSSGIKGKYVLIEFPKMEIAIREYWVKDTILERTPLIGPKGYSSP